ncbi:cwf21 domain-containing protein [Talaromyces proteolyticus]|uniref:Cwf21 domain-containing protein n=1 Tax=Talaromyces proteolyticus TaxID=1131652 RepID=A0AAD4KM14_9EURO|nr:cwf21 domain-containing protein [Talaromyces proteolyticus]KAH8695085.1 cwf21 domain-containing protein [Talaromyces proteolyticus]
MSSNVGLSTPRGSGTSGYVQRNSAFLKPRAAGFGAPYPPVSSSSIDKPSSGFKQRQPDKQILEHDRMRAIEVKVLEERERLEEENEDREKDKKMPLAEEEIDEKCDALRKKLMKEMEDGPDEGPKERRQFKSYQVHEQAEAKMQESERLRKALGIKEDWERPESREKDGSGGRRELAPSSRRSRE